MEEIIYTKRRYPTVSGSEILVDISDEMLGKYMINDIPLRHGMMVDEGNVEIIGVAPEYGNSGREVVWAKDKREQFLEIYFPDYVKTISE